MVFPADYAYKQPLNEAAVSGSAMPMKKMDIGKFAEWPAPPRLLALTAIVGMQIVAAAYFMLDLIDDMTSKLAPGSGFETIMDGVVAFALIAGMTIGLWYVRHMSAAIRRKDASLEIAKGALADHIAVRFSEWGLTSGEADVALFAMKGCNVAEIARMRNAAAGTVRSQLSQIYTKAGVSSQSMLVSLLIEDLLELGPAD